MSGKKRACVGDYPEDIRVIVYTMCELFRIECVVHSAFPMPHEEREFVSRSYHGGLEKFDFEPDDIPLTPSLERIVCCILVISIV